MKRIFAAAAALALVCILTACGTGSPAPEGGTTTPMDENKAAGTVTIPVPEETGDTPDDAPGAQAGGTYTNKTARITCKLDDSWLFYNDSQLLELNGVLTEAGGGDVASLAESGKAVYDMYAASTDGLMTMNVTYQNLGLLSGASMTAQEYVEQAAATLPGKPLRSTVTNWGWPSRSGTICWTSSVTPASLESPSAPTGKRRSCRTCPCTSGWCASSPATTSTA